ncbi:hypothetical protein EDB92DRAFT_1875448 [Lactarius akahatsu]|uniref:Secreted protein n=1 Tax=Lactarius akahatsu TaxID=416441 RepID=A0AAD4LGG1_9AGAM|nr:hypothetical protein EDB92DRAFT_1875448 [Lactarius akahatsu]
MGHVIPSRSRLQVVAFLLVFRCPRPLLVARHTYYSNFRPPAISLFLPCSSQTVNTLVAAGCTRAPGKKVNM